MCLSIDVPLWSIWHLLSFTGQGDSYPSSVLEINRRLYLWTSLFTDLPFLPFWISSYICTDLFRLLSWIFAVFRFLLHWSFLSDFFSFMYYCSLLSNFHCYIFISIKSIRILKENLAIRFLTFSLSSILLSPFFESGFHSTAQAVCKFTVIPQVTASQTLKLWSELSSSAAIFLSLRSLCVLIPSFVSLNWLNTYFVLHAYLLISSRHLELTFCLVNTYLLWIFPWLFKLFFIDFYQCSCKKKEVN